MVPRWRGCASAPAPRDGRSATSHLRDAAYRGARAAGVLDGGGVDSLHRRDSRRGLEPRARVPGGRIRAVGTFHHQLQAGALRRCARDCRRRDARARAGGFAMGGDVRARGSRRPAPLDPQLLPRPQLDADLDARGAGAASCRLHPLPEPHSSRSTIAKNRRRTSATIKATRPTPIAPATWRCSGRRSTLRSSRSRRGTGCGWRTTTGMIFRSRRLAA